MTFVNISGATASSYTLVTADLGAQMRVVVTATNSAGSASANAAQVGPVTAPPSNSAPPVISGSTTTGQTLTTTDGTWSGSPTFAYQWKSGGSNISGATSNSYLLVSGDVGATITVTVTATNSAGSTSATSAGVGPVTAFVVYNWSYIRIGNGGFITGVDIAPDGTMVCRADSSGAFVWNPAGNGGAGQWDQMFAGGRLSPKTDYAGGGVSEVLVAKKPGDSNIIMALWGGYAFKSTDRGATISKMAGWSKAELDGASSGDTSNTKASGPYGAFDPANSNIVYLSTTARGCRRTTDGGATWAPVVELGGGLPSGGYTATSVTKAGTDNTSVIPGLGSKTFSNNSPAFGLTVNGYTCAKVWSASVPTTQMIGQITASSGTSFTINVDTAFGPAVAKADWIVSPDIPGPNNNNTCGGHVVAFDTHAGTTTAFGQTVTKNVFVHTFGVGTFKSTDGGVTWTTIASTNTPKCIVQWCCDPYGVLWVTDGDYAGGVNARKYDINTDTWTIFSNDGRFYQCVAYDPLNSPSKGATTVTFGFGDHGFFRTMTDGGASPTSGYSFDSIPHRVFDSVPDGDVEWLTSYYNAYPAQFVAMGGIRYDPIHSGRLYMGMEGIWYSNGVPHSSGTSTIDLHQQSRGIEEFIPAQIISPQSGVVIPTAWDFTMFRTTNFNAWPAKLAGPIGESQGSFSMLFITYGTDFCGSVVATSLGNSNNVADNPTNKAFYSLNYGVAWTEFPTQPYPGQPPGTSIACSNDGNTFVVLPCRESYGLPKITTNAGVSWVNAALPGLTGSENWGYQQFYWPEAKYIESDKTTGDIYIYCAQTGAGPAMFKWTKSTGIWTRVNPSLGVSLAYIVPQFISVPGHAGHFLFAAGQTGGVLYSTNDGWVTVKTVPGFTWGHTLGIAAATGSYPAILVYGTRGGVDSHWLCEDFNASTGSGTWTDVGALAPSLGVPKCIAGDLSIPKQFYSWTANGAMVYKAA